MWLLSLTSTWEVLSLREGRSCSCNRSDRTLHVGVGATSNRGPELEKQLGCTDARERLPQVVMSPLLTILNAWHCSGIARPQYER